MHVQRSSSSERRGSPEETRRIIQEIEKINHSLGYRRRPSYAYPRVSPPSAEGYFYPRQTFRPEFLTKPKPIHIRFNGQRAINPFSNQNYFYPTPYLQAPQSKSPEFYPLIYAPINLGPFEVQKGGSIVNDGSVKLGTIVVLPEDESENRVAKAIDGTKKAKQNKLDKKEEKRPTLLEEIARIVGDEQLRQAASQTRSTVRAPMVKNDKFMNLDAMKDQKLEQGSRTPQPVPHNLHRAFNFTSSIERIQNFTNKFQVFQGNEKSDSVTTENLTETTSLSPLDVEEELEEAKDDKEDEKSPFGLLAFGPQQQLSTFKEGGLIIQRLRVRQGGIAIAGPGGVATVIN